MEQLFDQVENLQHCLCQKHVAHFVEFVYGQSHFSMLYDYGMKMATLVALLLKQFDLVGDCNQHRDLVLEPLRDLTRLKLNL